MGSEMTGWQVTYTCGLFGSRSELCCPCGNLVMVRSNGDAPVIMESPNPCHHWIDIRTKAKGSGTQDPKPPEVSEENR